LAETKNATSLIMQNCIIIANRCKRTDYRKYVRFFSIWEPVIGSEIYIYYFSILALCVHGKAFVLCWCICMYCIVTNCLLALLRNVLPIFIWPGFCAIIYISVHSGIRECIALHNKSSVHFYSHFCVIRQCGTQDPTRRKSPLLKSANCQVFSLLNLYDIYFF